MEVLTTSHAPSYPYSPTSQRPLRHRMENPSKKGTSHLFFFSKRSSLSGYRRLVLVAGAKKGNNEKKKKADSHVFVPRPDEPRDPSLKLSCSNRRKFRKMGESCPSFSIPKKKSFLSSSVYS
ncbi:hypothetical protein QJS10_CPA05g00166 [Acorus calamus]|uniref:Uncharacterized protein n=1 Tax=Acorus calamus TaxID=4465 RepID=A0AAV9ETL4_ACOCL|nr:hypothetical protein QJS10_CPA05g00166 [Acorus calamus]